jgi:lysophospholipase L1-like esterase
MTKHRTRSAVNEAALLLVLAMIGGAQAAEPQCAFPNEIIDMGHPLHRTLRPISTGSPLTIVALGSSSTAGAGASKPETSYPTRLREHLSSLLGHRVIVVNRGRNGDRVGDMLVRLPMEVFPEHPDAVIWQLGTNALLTALDREDFSSLFSRGVREITDAGAELIVMDPQFAPKVLSHRQAEEFVRLIDDEALQAGAALFRRFELMRFWHDKHLSFEQFLSPDQLHMNDWSYDCLADALAYAIVRSLLPKRDQ